MSANNFGMADLRHIFSNNFATGSFLGLACPAHNAHWSCEPFNRAVVDLLSCNSRHWHVTSHSLSSLLSLVESLGVGASAANHSMALIRFGGAGRRMVWWAPGTTADGQLLQHAMLLGFNISFCYFTWLLNGGKYVQIISFSTKQFFTRFA